MVAKSGNPTGVPRKAERVIDRLRFGLRDRLTKIVTVSNGDDRLRFSCTTRQEVFRAKTLFTKEVGTYAWIKEQVRPDDVIYDIGASIGLYSMLAALRLGPVGRVFAFEPHAGSFEHLCTNILLNVLDAKIAPVSVALNDLEGLFDFRYAIWLPGSSASQLLDRPAAEAGLRERKYATPIDAMVERGWLPPPDLVKIDVDGREPNILRGMARTLAASCRPRSVQVEIQKGGTDEIVELMRSMGYRKERHHLTMGGEAKLARGKTLDQIAYNAVFVPGT